MAADVPEPVLHSSQRGLCTPMGILQGGWMQTSERHKKVPLVEDKQMDSAVAVHQLHCTAICAYLSHNEQAPPFSPVC